MKRDISPVEWAITTVIIIAVVVYLYFIISNGMTTLKT